MSGSGSLWDHQKHSVAVKEVDHSLLNQFLHRCLCCDSTVLSQISALTHQGCHQVWPRPCRHPTVASSPSWLLPSSLLWALRVRKALLFPLGTLGQESSTLMVCLSSTELPWLQPYLWTEGEQKDSWSQTQRLTCTSERYNWGWVNIRRKINCFSRHPKCQKGQLGKASLHQGFEKGELNPFH